MDLETVRLCFKKYSTYLENNEKIMLPENTNFDEISITEIDRLTQTMFMNYVMNHSQKISLSEFNEQVIRPSELKEQVIRQMHGYIIYLHSSKKLIFFLIVIVIIIIIIIIPSFS